MWYQLFLDILPYDDSRRPIRDYVINSGRIILKPDTAVANSHVADTADVQVVPDSVAAAQDFLVSPPPASDDMTMFWASLFVVFVALSLCLWFAYSYRRSLTAKLK